MNSVMRATPSVGSMKASSRPSGEVTWSRGADSRCFFPVGKAKLCPEIGVGERRFASGPERAEELGAHTTQCVVLGLAHESRPQYGTEWPVAKGDATLELALSEPRRRFERQ